MSVGNGELIRNQFVVRLSGDCSEDRGLQGVFSFGFECIMYTFFRDSYLRAGLNGACRCN